MRLSLNELFALVTYCAVVAWIASLVGYDNSVFWLALFGSVVISTIFVWMAKDTNRSKVAALSPAPMFLCCLFPFVSISLLANAAILFCVGIFCACRPPLTVKTLIIVVMVCGLISLGIGVAPGMFALHDLDKLRDEFPVVDLQERLPFEVEQRDASNGQTRKLSSAVVTRLDQADLNRVEHSMRDIQFQNIHSHHYELFVRAIGFGVGRMLGSPYPESLRRPELADIPFAASADVEINKWKSLWKGGKSSDVEQLHDASRRDFLDPDGFGSVVESRERVIGFIEHGFHYSPLAAMAEPEEWRLVRLELVSLQKFDQPRVYVLDHLPRMDQLQGIEVPTRELDAFEATALTNLWTQQDIVSEVTGGHVRMLGSLRASHQCLDCHMVERGDLLGAFSYSLEKPTPITAGH